MAINTNPIFTPGQKLTPQQIADLKAGKYTGKFAPISDFQVNQVPRGTGVGVDAEFMDDPTGAGTTRYYQARNESTWGNNDVADVWDADGNYLGTSSGATDLRGLANWAATSAGSYYAQGLMTGGESGGLSAVDSAMIDVANSGGLQAGNFAGTTAAGTTAAGTTAATLGGEAAIDTAIANGGLGSTVADVGLNTSLGTLSPEMLTAATTIAGEGGIGTIAGGEVVKTAADTLKTGTDVKNGWDQLAKVVGGAVVSTVAGDALSDPVDTTKWDQLFDNMLSEQALAAQRSKDLWADYTNIWKPAQQQFAQTAMGYDTATRRESAAQDASGRVAASYDEQRMAAQREMERAGVDPSTIYALGVSSRLQQAKDEAGAENTARNDVEKTGLNLLKGVVDQGNTVVDQGTRQSQVATNTLTGASSLLSTQANVDNTNTQNRNAMIGDLFSAGLKAYGMFADKES